MSIEWLLRKYQNQGDEVKKRTSNKDQIMRRSELIIGLSILVIGTIIIILLLFNS